MENKYLEKLIAGWKKGFSQKNSTHKVGRVTKKMLLYLSYQLWSDV
jgi:hypothetical protein